VILLTILLHCRNRQNASSVNLGPGIGTNFPHIRVAQAQVCSARPLL